MRAVPTEPEPWIGLVEAVPWEPRPPDVDNDIGGAFTHFVCLAFDTRGFRAVAAHYFRSEGWRLVAIEDVEPVSRRLASGQPPRAVMEAIDRVRRNGKPGTVEEWDVYPADDEE